MAEYISVQCKALFSVLRQSCEQTEEALFHGAFFSGMETEEDLRGWWDETDQWQGGWGPVL